jgi:hypothetical protein
MKKMLALAGLLPILVGAGGSPVDSRDKLQLHTRGADQAHWMKVLQDSSGDTNQRALVVVHPTGLTDSYTYIDTDNSEGLDIPVADLRLSMDFQGQSDIYYRVQTDQGFAFLDVYSCGQPTDTLMHADVTACPEWTGFVSEHPTAKALAVTIWVQGIAGLNYLDNFTLGTGLVYSARSGKAESPTSSG